MKHIALILIIVCSTTTMAVAQNSGSHSAVRNGNRAYRNGHYDKALEAYQQDSTYYRARYNAGNAYYRQEQYDKAIANYDEALHHPTLSKAERAQVHHNLGNSHLKTATQNGTLDSKQLQQAVDNYREALKLDPKNDDTRYNLAYAQRLLQQAEQQQQQQGGQQNQDQQQGSDNNQNKDQNQDQQNQQNQQDNGNKDQDQNQDQQQNQQQNEQQGNDGDKKQQSAEAQQANIDPKDAERILQAIDNNERQTLKEQQQKKTKTRKKNDKDW